MGEGDKEENGEACEPCPRTCCVTLLSTPDGPCRSCKAFFQSGLGKKLLSFPTLLASLQSKRSIQSLQKGEAVYVGTAAAAKASSRRQLAAGCRSNTSHALPWQRYKGAR